MVAVVPPPLPPTHHTTRPPLPLLPTSQSPTMHPHRWYLPSPALPLRQGDEAKQEAAQQYASEKGVELDKGPGSSE